MKFPVPNINPASLTVAGLQKTQNLYRRRTIFAYVTLAVYFTLIGMWAWLQGNGFAFGYENIVEIIATLLLCLSFSGAIAWSVFGFTQAILGLWLIYRRRKFNSVPFSVASQLRDPSHSIAINAKTAVVMTVRNEVPESALRRLRACAESIAATQQGKNFDYFMLSDSSRPHLVAREGLLCVEWNLKPIPGTGRVFYRNRTYNKGFKAGNIFEFCSDNQSTYEFMIVLDADSLMDGETILSMVQIAQSYPRIGIVQSLPVGGPAKTLFTRLFQFGMRHNMRAYALAGAYWAGDSGQYWGHNALVRIKPFVNFCALPDIPGRSKLSGPILSHDQIEAALMRRGGFEVRVLPVECGSYEDNPPNLIEFCQRDQRWCLGNLQYLHLLAIPGLTQTSRFQLIWAVMMFLGLPAFNILLLLIALRLACGERLSPQQFGQLTGLYWIFLSLVLIPKITGVIDILTSAQKRANYGGATKFILGWIGEIGFSFGLAAIVGFNTALFAIGLPFRHHKGWKVQKRDQYPIKLKDACKTFWPATTFGIVLGCLFAFAGPLYFLAALPFFYGLALAIPFAVATASLKLSCLAQRSGIAASPEELFPPTIWQEMYRLENTYKSHPYPSNQSPLEKTKPVKL